MKRKQLARLSKTFFLLAVLILSACQSNQSNPNMVVNVAQTDEIRISPTLTPILPSSTPTKPVATPTFTAEPKLQACSPLEKIAIADLPSIISNPFEAPPPGRDDGHHGVDLAFYRFGELTSMDGLMVNAVFPGKVVGIINNRPPYGFAVIIETDLDSVEKTVPQLASVLPEKGQVEPHPALYCPNLNSVSIDGNKESLYLLYSHLKTPPTVTIGDQVVCGQTLGEVGTSGMSVNVHLHLEARVGPAGYPFPSMAHYENGATDEEMTNYCLWRVTNTFRMFDPMIFFNSQNTTP